MEQFEIGSKHGDWTIVAPGSKYYHMLCRCVCGREREVWKAKLGKRSTGCGCRVGQKIRSKMREYFRERDGSLLPQYVFKSYRSGAAVRGYEWGLSSDEFCAMTQLPCHYCGAPPSLTRRGYFGTYNGIDRMDNSKGYVSGNVVPCCWPCNKMKGRMGYREFIDGATRIADHFRSP